MKSLSNSFLWKGNVPLTCWAPFLLQLLLAFLLLRLLVLFLLRLLFMLLLLLCSCCCSKIRCCCNSKSCCCCNIYRKIRINIKKYCMKNVPYLWLSPNSTFSLFFYFCVSQWNKTVCLQAVQFNWKPSWVWQHCSMSAFTISVANI